MIDYLTKYNLNNNDIEEIKKRYSNQILTQYEVMMSNVCEVLNYLKEYGVTNLVNVILYRPDICFRSLDNLKQQLSKYDKDFICNIFNNDINDLITFDI